MSAKKRPTVGYWWKWGGTALEPDEAHFLVTYELDGYFRAHCGLLVKPKERWSVYQDVGVVGLCEKCKEALRR